MSKAEQNPNAEVGLCPAINGKRAKKDERDNALRLVEDHIRESNIAPGFDYQKTVEELEDRFSDEQIGLACGEPREGGLSKSTVENWRKGEDIPRHDRGERLWILYVETFSRRDTNGKIIEEKKPPFKYLKE
jgi:hypothetical protein